MDPTPCEPNGKKARTMKTCGAVQCIHCTLNLAPSPFGVVSSLPASPLPFVPNAQLLLAIPSFHQPLLARSMGLVLMHAFLHCTSPSFAPSPFPFSPTTYLRHNIASKYYTYKNDSANNQITITMQNFKPLLMKCLHCGNRCTQGSGVSLWGLITSQLNYREFPMIST